MSILNIQPVVRGESKVLLAFCGPSGTGKTLSALYVARGMVSKTSEIGFLDTENGRGSFYSDKLDGQFMYANLNPPFSPDRYGKAIKEFQNAGVKVLVIDSISHEWEGIGGCEDIAEAPKADGTERKVADWKRAKSDHRTKFMNSLMYADMHIICCVRAREKTSFKDITKPVSLGIQPVSEKNFLFEMMASVMFSNEGKNQSWIKVPDYLKEAFGTGTDYLGRKTGEKIMDWVRLGEKEDPIVTKCRGDIILVCEQGLEALKKAWEAMPDVAKKALKPEASVHAASAKAFDEARAGEKSETTDLLEDLTALFEAKQGGMSGAQKINIGRIIENKEVASYQKAINELKEI
jgi:hypothetical protein